jgi:hypothetical protein
MNITFENQVHEIFIIHEFKIFYDDLNI